MCKVYGTRGESSPEQPGLTAAVRSSPGLSPDHGTSLVGTHLHDPAAAGSMADRPSAAAAVKLKPPSSALAGMLDVEGQRRCAAVGGRLL